MKAISKSCHSSFIYDAYASLKIVHPKVTHAGQQNDRQLLDKAGVEKVSADVAGGWSTGAGKGCYSNGLSLPSMRAMAGFPPDEKVYYLPRSGLQPPENLLKSIFPTIDDWHWKLKNGVDVEHNFALDGYLCMLFFFHEVIIQDAAVMIDHHPNIIFQHPLFSTDDFLSY
jgi:hypothetical protein